MTCAAAKLMPIRARSWPNSDAVGRPETYPQAFYARDLAGRVVLVGVPTPEMRLDQEEIFGPLLPILPYSDLGQVIDRINSRDKPLALYIFDRDQARIDRILAETTSGGVGINLTVVHYTQGNLPFGGVNSSGIGASHGLFGFRAFSHERAVLRNRFLALPILFPPYGRRTMRLIGLIKRILG